MDVDTPKAAATATSETLKVGHFVMGQYFSYPIASVSIPAYSNHLYIQTNSAQGSPDP